MEILWVNELDKIIEEARKKNHDIVSLDGEKTRSRTWNGEYEKLMW